jgi:hypothetical protein
MTSACALLLAAGGCSSESAVVHEDDEAHPLSLTYGGAGESALYPPEDRVDGERWTGTFGAFLPCTIGVKGPVKITEIEWSSDRGLEPESVETFVRSFDGATSDPYMSMHGSPLDTKDEWFDGDIRNDAVGYTVATPCEELGRSTGQMDEIMVSVGVGDTGGHIGHLRFHYEAGDDPYILEIDWDFYFCGSAVPDEFECP